jgi:hypothetical protein
MKCDKCGATVDPGNQLGRRLLWLAGALFLIGASSVITLNLVKRGTSGVLQPGASELSASEALAARGAISALAKINAAVEVGVNFQQYGGLLIDAKAAVNEASRVLKKGKLLDAILETSSNYTDAMEVWNNKIQYRERGLKKVWLHLT